MNSTSENTQGFNPEAQNTISSLGIVKEYTKWNALWPLSSTIIDFGCLLYLWNHRSPEDIKKIKSALENIGDKEIDWMVGTVKNMYQQQGVRTSSGNPIDPTDQRHRNDFKDRVKRSFESGIKNLSRIPNDPKNIQAMQVAESFLASNEFVYLASVRRKLAIARVSQSRQLTDKIDQDGVFTSSRTSLDQRENNWLSQMLDKYKSNEDEPDYSRYDYLSHRMLYERLAQAHVRKTDIIEKFFHDK